MNVKKEFHVPVAELLLPDLEEVNLEISRTLIAIMASDATFKGFDTGIGWKSKIDPLSLNKKEFKVLREIITLKINEYLENVFPQINKQNFSIKSWSVILGNGGFQYGHVHTLGDFVAVYYPKMDKKNTSGSLTLLDPIPSRAAKGYPWTNDRLSIKANESKLIIFPSFIPHQVQVYRGKEYRISINMDIKLN